MAKTAKMPSKMVKTATMFSKSDENNEGVVKHEDNTEKDIENGHVKNGQNSEEVVGKSSRREDVIPAMKG